MTHISQKWIPNGLVNNKQSVDQEIYWSRTGGKSLPVAMVV